MRGKFYCMHRLGYLRELKNVDFSRVNKLIFICAGNICRSPLGEFYARYLGLEAESYGLNCRGGDPADPRIIAIAENLGMDVGGHVTRNIRDYRPLPDHLVVAMEPGQIEALPTGVKSQAQITLAPLWYNQPNLYLHDPYSANPNYFDKCTTNLMGALDNLKERLDEHA